jgi:hypothetical protein
VGEVQGQDDRTMTDGCCVLAMLWDSAWAEGGGPALAQTLLKRFNKPTLRGIYEDQKFLPSAALGQIDQFLYSVREYPALFPIHGEREQHITRHAAVSTVTRIHEQHAAGDSRTGTV